MRLILSAGKATTTIPNIWVWPGICEYFPDFLNAVLFPLKLHIATSQYSPRFLTWLSDTCSHLARGWIWFVWVRGRLYYNWQYFKSKFQMKVWEFVPLSAVTTTTTRCPCPWWCPCAATISMTTSVTTPNQDHHRLTWCSGGFPLRRHNLLPLPHNNKILIIKLWWGKHKKCGKLSLASFGLSFFLSLHYRPATPSPPPPENRPPLP